MKMNIKRESPGHEQYLPHETADGLHIAEELARIADILEFFALCEMERREKTGFYGPPGTKPETKERLSELSERIKGGKK